ncbi:MAG: manganese oxidase, partial [Acidobacteriota bacterium]|nr:manganese oxidase [Acidobacteriota bacterium]
MSVTRRNVLFSSVAATVGGLLTGRQAEAAPKGSSAEADRIGAPGRRTGVRTSVVTPNVGPSLPWHLAGGVKEFHLTAEPVRREFVDGLNVNCWGYNGSTPGPTIEAFEGD